MRRRIKGAAVRINAALESVILRVIVRPAERYDIPTSSIRLFLSLLSGVIFIALTYLVIGKGQAASYGHLVLAVLISLGPAIITLVILVGLIFFGCLLIPAPEELDETPPSGILPWACLVSGLLLGLAVAAHCLWRWEVGYYDLAIVFWAQPLIDTSIILFTRMMRREPSSPQFLGLLRKS
jgi:hypothetical protein